jgi:hypothetical protein
VSNVENDNACITSDGSLIANTPHRTELIAMSTASNHGTLAATGRNLQRRTKWKMALGSDRPSPYVGTRLESEAKRRRVYSLNSVSECCLYLRRAITARRLPITLNSYRCRNARMSEANRSQQRMADTGHLCVLVLLSSGLNKPRCHFVSTDDFINQCSRQAW